MSLHLAVFALLAATAGSLIFSTLTYALRDLSRARLADYLQRHRRQHMLDPTTQHAGDLIFVTAVLRMLANTLIVLATVWICEITIHNLALRDGMIFLIAAVVTFIFSVTLPHTLAKNIGDSFVGASAGVLLLVRKLLLPFTKLMHLIDRAVRTATGAHKTPQPEVIEQEILSVVEEGEEQGVVDEQEREMIESVIEFRDTTAGQIMTARPDIVALPINSSLAHVKQTIEESGHSRIPVYEGTLDQIVGILYARDLLRFIGQPPEQFDMRAAMRPPLYAPETKPLRDLLRDFRVQKVHIAIVLDEYGGTAGLITIEDILEELVGDISDEHEPVEPSLFRRIDEQTAEADARIPIDEFNRLTGSSIPEDAGYTTLGGFLSTALGRIPTPGTTFEQSGVKYTVLEAEPQRVRRVRVEQVLQPAESVAPDVGA